MNVHISVPIICVNVHTCAQHSTVCMDPGLPTSAFHKQRRLSPSTHKIHAHHFYPTSHPPYDKHSRVPLPVSSPPPPLRLKTNLHHNHIGALKEASKGGPWSCCLCVWARACLQPGQQRAGEPREGKRVAGVLFLGSRGLVIHAMEMNDLIFPSYLFFVCFSLSSLFLFFRLCSFVLFVFVWIELAWLAAFLALVLANTVIVLILEMMW